MPFSKRERETEGEKEGRKRSSLLLLGRNGHSMSPTYVMWLYSLPPSLHKQTKTAMRKWKEEKKSEIWHKVKEEKEVKTKKSSSSNLAVSHRRNGKRVAFISS